MKKFSIGFLLFSGACIFSACSGSDTNTENTTSTDSTVTSHPTDTSSNANMDTTTTAGTALVDQDARDFVNEAATGGMMEVELGKIAAEKGKSKDVKDFGKMMVDDHTKANENLKILAGKKNINVPAGITIDQKKEVDGLSKKSGADFDKAYIDMMVDDHKKDVSAFKDAAGKLSDNDIKNFATNTLPTLQKHLEAIQAIKAKM